MEPRIVIDTGVLTSALSSRNGASFRLLALLGSGKFIPSISVPLVLEYEGSAKAQAKKIKLNHSDIDDIIDYLCSVAEPCDIHFLWRPVLGNPSDDMVLELAVESGSDFILTHGKADFKKAVGFGIGVMTPREFLQKIGELK